MFSQWRHAVESTLSQPVTKSAGTDDASSEPSAIRTSFSASSQLAETALTNLRKTAVSNSPASPSAMAGATEPPNKSHVGGRTTLEERLRAKFAIGDASNTTTPASSSRTSPSPVPGAQHPLALDTAPSNDIPEVKGEQNDPLSPTSTALPDSPALSPTIEASQPLASIAASVVSNDGSVDAQAQIDLDGEADEGYPPNVSGHPNPPDPTEGIVASLEAEERASNHAGSVTELKSPLAEVPPDALPTPPEESAIQKAVDETHLQTDTESALSLQIPTPAAPAIDALETVICNGDATHTESSVAPAERHAPAVLDRPLTPSFHDSTDVEALQKRLRLVEQRFVGMSF